MKVAFITVILLFLSANAFGQVGYIVQGATLTLVASTSGNQDSFRVSYTGGTGDQCNGQIWFHLSHAGSESVYKNAFAVAMTAFIAGKKVDIYRYIDSQICAAAFISMY